MDPSPEEQLLALFHKYILAFNEKDLNFITATLDEKLETVFQGKVASTGREAVIPYYVKDFEDGKKVEILQEAVLNVGSEPGSGTVKVDLKAVVPEGKPTTLTVEYLYVGGRQVRHTITNVVVTE